MALIPTTPATVDYRRRMAYELMKEGSDASPVQHWAQGLARLGQGALGGYEMYQADQKDKENEAEAAKAYISLLQGGAPVASQAAPMAPAAPPMPTPSRPLPPSNTPVVSTDPAPVSGPRPGGPVMPSAKVWGDAEAEAAGLYEPAPKNVRLASALARPEIPAQTPMPAGPPAPQAPQMAQALAQPVAQPVPSDDPRKAKIIQLLSGNRAEQKMGRALADNYVAQQFKPETTDEIKEYNLAKKQGFSGSFFDFKVGLKKAGATNVTTNVEKGEDAFAKAAGSAQAKRFDELAGEGQKAKQMVADIDTLNELGKNIGTGKGAEILAKIGPWADSIGVPVKGLSDIQAFEAIVNRVAPSLRVPGSGAQSDYELKNFLKSLPALGNTPEGNAIATSTMKGLQENKIRAAEIGSRALNGEITRPEAEKLLRSLPDPMDSYRAYTKANKQGATAPAKAAPIMPQPGEIRDGYRFKGGDPADPKSWEQAT
jgi:hypothetical protein